MFKVLVLLGFSLIFQPFSFAQQDYSFNNEISFASHLIDNYEFNNATLVLKKLSRRPNLSLSQFDSINFYRGWISYNKKNLDTSSFYLNKVTSNSSFYYKSKFYSAFNTAYMGHYSKALVILDSLKTDTFPDYTKLKNFEMASYSLLEHDYKQFEILASNFDGSYFPTALEEKSLKNYYTKLREHKSKSRLLAGTMSAIIPGSGKYYTGFKGQGATAFATVVTLAAIAAESYYRAGPKSIQFISFGAIFSIFYVGNIWGSVNCVKKRDESFYKEIDRNVLLDMHFPLRRVFN